MLSVLYATIPIGGMLSDAIWWWKVFIVLLVIAIPVSILSKRLNRK